MSTLHRHRKGELTYRSYLKKVKQTPSLDCTFCTFKKNDQQVLKEHRYFLEVENIFPYSLWDSSRVTEHAMLVPKRHVTSLSQLNADEAKQYVALISKKEEQGYDIFSRGHNSNMKSVPHQHTHLIKTNGRKIKSLIYHESPLVTIHRY